MFFSSLVLQLAVGLDYAERRPQDPTPVRRHQLCRVGQRQDHDALRLPAERGHPLHAVPGDLDPGGEDERAADAGALGDGPADHLWQASGALRQYFGGVQTAREQDY